MVEKNYQFLGEALSSLGFGDSLNDALKTKMKLGFPEFELKAKADYGKDKMEYALKFGKKEDGEFYFLNGYSAKLTKENGEALSQGFPLFQQRGFGVDETYNLLSGRAVYNSFRKDGQVISRWSRLDFTTQNDKGNFPIKSYYDSKNNFNLVKELSKLPLMANAQEDKEELIRNLQRGNLEPVTVRQQGNRDRVYIEATPQHQRITAYNDKMERVNLGPNKMQVVQEEKQEGKVTEVTKQLMDKANSTSMQDEKPKKKVS